MHHDAAHDEEKAEGGALTVLQELVDVYEPAEIAYDVSRGGPEEIEADTEKDGIEYSGDKDPFPDLMLRDKVVRFDVTLERYDDFFEHEQVKRTYLCPIDKRRLQHNPRTERRNGRLIKVRRPTSNPFRHLFMTGKMLSLSRGVYWVRFS